MGKKYKCQYCEKTCPSSRVYRKEHKSSFFHRNNVLGHYQKSNPKIMWSCRHAKFFGRCPNWKACDSKYLTETSNKQSDLINFESPFSVVVSKPKKFMNARDQMLDFIPNVFIDLCPISELPKSLLPVNEDVISSDKAKREYQEKLYLLHNKIVFN